MTFIASKLFIHVYSRWREEFVEKKSTSFGYRSIILATHVCQLSRLIEEPLHGCNTIGNVLWKKINNVFTMDTIFYQQVDHSKQEYFLKLLTNIRRVGSLLYDWDILMSQLVTGFLEHKINLFDSTINSFSTNNLVTLHNRYMMKSLNSPIAWCVVEKKRHKEIVDDQLKCEVTLFHGQPIMLTWYESVKLFFESVHG